MTLIVAGGLPGAGKSSLADALAERLQAPVFTKDRIEASLWRNGVTAEANSNACAVTWICTGNASNGATAAFLVGTR